jgi:hypothetical protein
MYRQSVLTQIAQIRKTVLTTRKAVPWLPSSLHNEEHCGMQNKQQRRHFKNFGHKKQQEPLFTRLWYSFVVLTFVGCAVDWKG